MKTSTFRRNVVHAVSIGVAGIALVVGSAQAQTASDTFQVTATVLASCTVTAFDLAFGNYPQNSPLPVNASSTIEVNCASGLNYDVGLNFGNNGTTPLNRAMARVPPGGPNLPYNLYQDVALAILWGNSVGVNTVSGIGNGGLQSIFVFGQIPALQNPNPGNFVDTVTATVFF